MWDPVPQTQAEGKGGREGGKRWEKAWKQKRRNEVSMDLVTQTTMPPDYK